MELRIGENPEPTHIHVQRPSRSEPGAAAQQTEVDLDQQREVSEAADTREASA